MTTYGRRPRRREASLTGGGRRPAHDEFRDRERRARADDEQRTGSLFESERIPEKSSCPEGDRLDGSNVAPRGGVVRTATAKMPTEGVRDSRTTPRRLAPTDFLRTLRMRVLPTRAVRHLMVKRQTLTSGRLVILVHGAPQ